MKFSIRVLPMLLGLWLTTSTGFAATCFCKVTADGQEMQRYTDGGYTQPFGNNKCEKRCGGIWDGLPNADLIQWAQEKKLCGRQVDIKMESAVGTGNYREVRAGKFEIPACESAVEPAASWFRYAAKFACGVIPAPSKAGDLLVPGRFLTTINVHNPHEGDVTIRKRFSFGLGFEQQGPLSQGFSTTLGSARTIDIQCADILNHSNNPQANTGYALIESPVELDVVSLYSAANATSEVSTVHSERVPAREIAAPTFTPCPDGNTGVNASTGTATWTVQPSGGTQVTASTIPAANRPSSWGNVAGATWIGTPPGIASSFTYQTCFCRCRESATSIQLQGLADNSVAVSLNANNIYAFGHFAGNPPLSTVNNPSFFVPGLNCLRATVTNQAGTPTGLNLMAMITGATPTNANGTCPF